MLFIRDITIKPVAKRLIRCNEARTLGHWLLPSVMRLGESYAKRRYAIPHTAMCAMAKMCDVAITDFAGGGVSDKRGACCQSPFASIYKHKKSLTIYK
jgi:hypothetical protein